MRNKGRWTKRRPSLRQLCTIVTLSCWPPQPRTETQPGWGKKKDTNAPAGGLTLRWVKSRRVSATGAAFVLLKASDRANQRTLRTGGVPCVYMATSCSVLLRKWGRCVCVRARVRVFFFSIAARRGLGGGGIVVCSRRARTRLRDARRSLCYYEKKIKLFLF